MNNLEKLQSDIDEITRQSKQIDEAIERAEKKRDELLLKAFENNNGK